MAIPSLSRDAGWRDLDHRQGARPIRLGLNSHTGRSERGAFGVATLAILGIACGSGLALALVGCAGKCEPQIQYVRAGVPVPVLCCAPEVAVPPWAAAGLRKADNFEVKIRSLLAERRQRIGYEKQILAALASCQ